MKTNSAWQQTLQACDSQALIKASGCKWSILQRHSRTDCLYLCSIRLLPHGQILWFPGTVMLSVWTHTVMLTSSWCREGERRLIFHLFLRCLKIRSTDQWENWFAGNYAASRNMPTLVKKRTEGFDQQVWQPYKSLLIRLFSSFIYLCSHIVNGDQLCPSL